MSLNPGIRRTVAWLNERGFTTTDSGDGKTHDHPCDRDHAYAVIVVKDAPDLVYETNRLYRLLLERGLHLGPMSMEATPCIQASYDPGNRIAVIDLMHVDDELLFGGRKGGQTT